TIVAFHHQSDMHTRLLYATLKCLGGPPIIRRIASARSPASLQYGRGARRRYASAGRGAQPAMSRIASVDGVDSSVNVVTMTTCLHVDPGTTHEQSRGSPRAENPTRELSPTKCDGGRPS